MPNRPRCAPGRRRACRSTWGRLATGLLAPLLFAGCTSFGEYVHNGFKVGPNYVRPPAQTSADWIDSSDARVKSDPPADCAWWTVLNDPALNGLIGSAYRQNLDLRAAGARITEARAQRAIAVGSLFPQTQTMTISALESQISQNLPIPFPQNFDLVTAGFNGSWELDFWGRYRRAVESADANLSASVEQYGEVLVLLLSDVASNYVQLRTFQQRLAYARQNVEIQRGSLKLAEMRLKQGVSSELDVRQARAILWQTESLVPVYEAGARQSSNALCVLLGMSPIDLASALGTAPIPIAPPSVALGVPNDLLARRPDVRRAERRVAEQCARIGIATSDLYPALSVNGYVGFWAQNTHELFNGDSFTGALIPRFNWNVLNYGRIANNIIAQDARLQAVAYDYQQTVLRAGQEVEDGLTRFLHAQMQARFLDRSVADTARAVELVKVQFEGGTTDFNRVFTLQASLTSQQDQLAAAQGNIALSLIAVYKGLGGGWRCFQACGGMPAPCYPPEVETVPPPAPELLPPPPALSPSGQTPVQVAHHVAPPAGPAPAARAAAQLPIGGQPQPAAGPLSQMPVGVPVAPATARLPARTVPRTPVVAPISNPSPLPTGPASTLPSPPSGRTVRPPVQPVPTGNLMTAVMGPRGTAVNLAAPRVNPPVGVGAPVSAPTTSPSAGQPPAMLPASEGARPLPAAGGSQHLPAPGLPRPPGPAGGTPPKPQPTVVPVTHLVPVLPVR